MMEIAMPEKANDNNAALVAEEVTDEQVANFDLSTHIIKLMWSEPFFAEILRIMRKTPTNTIPTAGVYIRNNEMNLVYNPRFMAGLSNSEVFGLLKHECYHLVFEQPNAVMSPILSGTMQQILRSTRSFQKRSFQKEASFRARLLKSRNLKYGIP